MSVKLTGVTIAIGEQHCRLAEIATRRLRECTGLDSVVLGEDALQYCGLRNPNHLKFRLFDLVEAEHILYFDSDLFCLQPWDPRQYAGRDAWVAVRGFWFDDRVRELGKRLGFGAETFNGGFFIINRLRHRPVLKLAERLQPADGLFGGFFSVDEIALSAALARLNVPIEFLDRRYNWIGYGRGNLAGECNVVQAHACAADLRRMFCRDKLPLYPHVPDENQIGEQIRRMIAGGSWLYQRDGYGARALEFRDDGTIGDGGSDAERYWLVSHSQGEPRLVIGSAFDVTCSLRQDLDGTWRSDLRRQATRLRPHAPAGNDAAANVKTSVRSPSRLGRQSTTGLVPKESEFVRRDDRPAHLAANGDQMSAPPEVRTEPVPVRGVISACDEPFFPGFQLLVQSLKEFPVDLFDLGLSEPQRHWCRSRGIALHTPELVVPRTVPGWQSWNKPLYLAASRFETTLWLDCDCLVVGSLDRLFDSLEHQPLITRHWEREYPRPNAPELYDRHATRRRFESRRLVNAGVLGIRKSRDLKSAWFGHWTSMVHAAAQDPDLQCWISYWDEGALIWALEASGEIDLPTTCEGWNRCQSIVGFERPRDLWTAAAGAGSDVIWHFTGTEKVWSQWNVAGHLLNAASLTPDAPAYDFGSYPHNWQKPEWSTDLRHIEWIFDMLASKKFRTTLEIGCLHGAISSAFVEAVNRELIQQATFCDIDFKPAFHETLAHCRYPERLWAFSGRSVDLLRQGAAYDFVMIDGDHRMTPVWEELETLLRLPPKCIMAHDTSASPAGYTECEGPGYLKWRLQTIPGWFCLEDNFVRRGEATERGLFLATPDPEVFEIGRAALALRCPVID